jgi:hypothetical protein
MTFAYFRALFYQTPIAINFITYCYQFCERLSKFYEA